MKKYWNDWLIFKCLLPGATIFSLTVSVKKKKLTFITMRRAITNLDTTEASFKKKHWDVSEWPIVQFLDAYITDQHHLQCMSLTYDMLKGSNPDIYDLLKSQIGQRHISLRSTTERPQDLRVSIPANLHSPKNFLSYIAQHWNNLPSEIKNAGSRKSFKKHHKNHLITQYHTKVQCLNNRCTDKKYHLTHWSFIIFFFY